jgi:hypothetical protein
MVARKGDARAGAVLVKVVDRREQGRQALQRSDARRRRALLDAAHQVRVRARPGRLCRAGARIDPDVWVVEIEDRDGRHFLTEAVEA